MPKAQGGRRALDPVIQARLLKSLRQGNFLDVAVASADMTMGEFAEAMRWGKTLTRPEEIDADEWSQAKSFARAVESAEATSEGDAVGALWRASQSNTQALIFYMQNRFPERWGKKPSSDQPFGNLAEMTDDQIAKRLKELGFKADPLPAPDAAHLLPPAPPAPPAPVVIPPPVDLAPPAPLPPPPALLAVLTAPIPCAPPPAKKKKRKGKPK